MFGERADFSAGARRLHAQDASIYQIAPLGVVRPKTAAEVAVALRLAGEYGVPVTPRGGGTSLAGQAIGPGLLLDVSRFLRRILSVDADAGRAWVEPGVIQDDLNDAVAPYGLMFAPDTSTSRQATIGGMIGNNSCGAYSLRYGTTRDHLLAARGVLADGRPFYFPPPDTPDDGSETAARSGDLAEKLRALVDGHRRTILENWPRPDVRRRNTGYALDDLARGRPWMADGPAFQPVRLLCGSEGTLAVVTAAEVRLVPRPAARRLACPHFPDVAAAARAARRCLAHNPAAVELLDGALFAATAHHREHAANRAWVRGEPGAVLAVEFHAESETAAARAAAALVDDLRAEGVADGPVLAGAEIARVWALRKAGLGLLTGLPGDAKPATGLEDTAVAPEDLENYLGDVRNLMARHGCDCVYYGHAAAGLIHLRPMLNLKEPRDVARLAALLDELAVLVKKYRGALSGEHGDGRLRGGKLGLMLGPEGLALCRLVKQLFDPAGRLNPGVLVDADPPFANLRLTPGQPTAEVPTVMDWSARAGFARAVEACNGAGFCRQSAGRGAVMCPSYMATGEEQDTPRARANLLRQLLAEIPPPVIARQPDLRRALDTCLACKACAGECPSSVDVARIKAEVLQWRHRHAHGAPGDWLAGHYARLARWACRAPTLANRLMNSAWMRRAAGWDPRRPLPPFADETLEYWFARHRPPPGAGVRGTVVLLGDEFINYSDVAVGRAVITLLEKVGFKVHLRTRLDTARPLISKGYLTAARRALERTVHALAPEAERGTPILGIEPSALLGLRDEAPDLVRASYREAARRVRAATRLWDEFLAEKGHGAAAFPPLENEVLLHIHCHQKALADPAATRRVLEWRPGIRVRELNAGCCGMAGSFGYEAAHYELSMKIGEMILFPAVRAAPDAVVCASGVSCRQQIRHGTGRLALHPAELLV